MEKELKELRELEDKKRQIVEEIQAKKDEIVEKYSSVKIGDVVEANGYGCNGKKINVSFVAFNPDRWRKTNFFAKGKVLNKDGTLHARNYGEYRF